MAGRGRGKEVALQAEVESQEEWEELISKEGLTVIDVYQEWCGPCKAMLSNFKRFKNEIGDELLRFAVAKADSIEALERYRGKCEPCFLFYAGGLLVDVIRGANSPMLQKKMVSQLAYEHKVLEGLAERKEIRDPNLPHREDKHAKAAVDAGVEESDEDESSDEDEDETRVYLEKMFTVGIIKPDIYADGKADDIIEKIRESGFDILEQMERIFAPEEVQELYSNMKEEENFPEVIKDMCNGPSIILVLSKGEYGEGIIEEWQEYLGPELVSEAKEHAPKSVRAIYCSSGQPHSNGFHGSSSLEAAKRELNLFFPDFVIPKISITHIRPQRIPTTIAVIRPAALESYREEILEKIAAEEFRIELQKEMQMTRGQVEAFYKEQKEEPYFEELLESMTSGPMLVLALSATENVVEKWRSLLGSKDVEKAAVLEPESFRGKFCVRGVNVNQFHGSETEELAQKEFDYFFPMEQSLVAIKPHAFYNRDAIIHKISLAGFRIVARKEMELPAEKIKSMYRSCMLKEFFGDLANSMMRGPTTFLIVSKPNAVADWRALAGPTDPEVARAEAPTSIRALFGKDILRNAVHSPSSIAAAKEEIALVFGDIEFDADGLLKRKKRQKRRKSSDEECRPGEPDDDEDRPATMATSDKYEKEKPIGTADRASVFAAADSQLEDLSQIPGEEKLILDLATEMPIEDSQVEDLDALERDTYARMAMHDDQNEDLMVKDALEERLIAEERPPERWGVEVEVPLEDDGEPAAPCIGEIQLETSPEASWAEHMREMERLAQLKLEAEMAEKQRAQEVMDEREEVMQMMAEQMKVPELLAEEKWEEEAQREISEEPGEAKPLPEQPVETQQQVEEPPGEQPREEQEQFEVPVEPTQEEIVPVEEEVIPVQEEQIIPAEELFVPPEEPVVPPEEPVVPPEEPVVPPEEVIEPEEVGPSEEERETAYPMPDSAKEETEALPKEEEPADLPIPDFDEWIEEGEGPFDDSGKQSAGEGRGEQSEEEQERHEDKEELGQHGEQREDHDGKHDEGKNRGSEEDKDLEGHKDSDEKSEHKEDEERKDDVEHKGDEERRDDVEHKGDEEHKDDVEHKGDEERKEDEERRENEEHREDEERKEDEHKEEIQSQKDGGEESKQEGDNEDERK